MNNQQIQAICERLFTSLFADKTVLERVYFLWGTLFPRDLVGNVVKTIAVVINTILFTSVEVRIYRQHLQLFPSCEILTIPRDLFSEESNKTLDEVSGNPFLFQSIKENSFLSESKISSRFVGDAFFNEHLPREEIVQSYLQVALARCGKQLAKEPILSAIKVCTAHNFVSHVSQADFEELQEMSNKLVDCEAAVRDLQSKLPVSAPVPVAVNVKRKRIGYQQMATKYTAGKETIARPVQADKYLELKCKLNNLKNQRNILEKEHNDKKALLSQRKKDNEKMSFLFDLYETIEKDQENKHKTEGSRK